MKLGMKIYDFSKVHQVPREEFIDKVCDAFNHFAKKLHASTGAKIVGPDALLQGPAPVVTGVQDTGPDIDRGYEAIFDEVDMRGQSVDYFEVEDISGGVTFFQIEPGEEVKLSKIPKASKFDVKRLKFAGGFTVLDDWLKYNKYYKIEQLSKDVILGYYDRRAQLFYGLIEALDSSIDFAFDTDDSTTINKACANILETLKGKGYKGLGPNTRFLIVCHENLRFRILKALAAAFSNPNQNTNQIVYNVKVVPTTYISSNYYYVCLPGLKAKRGEWEDLTARPPQRDELKLGEDRVWVCAYNGVIGEKDQFRRCALA